MTRSPQELAQTVRDAACRGRVDQDALSALVALAEAGERAQEALRQIASRELVTRPLGTADGVDYVEPMSYAQIARAALGEGS